MNFLGLLPIAMFIVMVILIIGAGGALKQTIIDTGIGDTIGSLMSAGGVSPYIMAWLITVLIRLATGSNTLKTWGMLELVNSVVGLGMVLLLSLFV